MVTHGNVDRCDHSMRSQDGFDVRPVAGKTMKVFDRNGPLDPTQVARCNASIDDGQCNSKVTRTVCETSRTGPQNGKAKGVPAKYSAF